MLPLGAAAFVGGLTLTKKCGESTKLLPGKCQDYEYCSSHGPSCEPCEHVCVEGNNYDQEICESQCQDFIHDKIKHYVMADADKSSRDMQDTIENLRSLVAVSLSLSVLLLIALIVVGGFIWLRHRRMIKREQDMMEKKMSSLNTIANNNALAENRHKPPSSASNTAAPSVVTEFTHVSRRPEEDSTLEYAYDNEGMVPSPVVRDPRDHETIF